MVDEKLSEMVLLSRWRDEYTLVGAPSALYDIEEAADILAQNAWMRPWIASKIRDALHAGEVFNYMKRVDAGWRGREDGKVAEWRMASVDEMLKNATSDHTSSAPKQHTHKAKSNEASITLHYHDGPELIDKYDNLPRQARVVLDLLNETRSETFSDAAINLVMQQGKEKLNTKQDPMKIFTFYRKRLIEEGHLDES